MLDTGRRAFRGAARTFDSISTNRRQCRTIEVREYAETLVGWGNLYGTLREDHTLIVTAAGTNEARHQPTQMSDSVNPGTAGA